MTDTLLRVERLHVCYGAVQALRGVDVEISAGRATGVLGANGAGKTTLVRAIMSLVPAAEGTITGPGGRGLRGRRPHQVARAGVAMVPEGGGTFPYLTVRENLLVGPSTRRRGRAEQERLVHAAYERFPALADREQQLAATLSGGERQMLAISRALTTEPQVLLLDEPSLGLAPLVVEAVFKAIDDLVATGIGLLIIEQNARKALQSCTTAVVLERGVVRLSGSAAELARDPDVIAAYLGGADGKGGESAGAPSPAAR